MEVNREGIQALRSETRVFNTYEAVVAKGQLQEGTNVMYEGRNIHSSPVDGKLLCSYSEKLCKQRRLNGYAFCIRHVLEDKNSPFKQCQYVAKYNGQQCTNPIPLSEDRIYCNSHLQVLGLVPKKSRKKKISESNENESERPLETLKPVKIETPSLPVGLSDFPSSFVALKPKSKRILKRQDTSVPAVEELRQNLAKKRQREDIFLNYGIESSEESDEECNHSRVSPCQHVYLPADECEKQHEFSEKVLSEQKECDFKALVLLRAARLAKFQQQLQRELCQLQNSYKTQSSLQQRSISPIILLKAARADLKDTVSVLKEQESRRKARLTDGSSTRLSCSYQNDGVCCKKRSLPYTRFCKAHINNDPKQSLYNLCTAKFPGGVQCSVPVFDVSHERPLCQEHAQKTEKFFESQEMTVPLTVPLAIPAKLSSPDPKQAKKTSRRKQAQVSKSTSSNKANKSTRKPPKKNVPKVIVKLPKPPNKEVNSSGLNLIQTMDTNHSDNFPLDNQIPALSSPSLSLSPATTDHTESDNRSSLSPKLNFQQMDPEYIEAQQRNGIILPTAEEAAEIQRVLAAANVPISRSSHSPPSVAQLKEAVAKIAPLVGKGKPTTLGLNLAFGDGLMCLDDEESPQKELDTFEHTDKTLPFLNSRTSNCKHRHDENRSYTSSHSVENILSSSHNAIENGKDSGSDSSFPHLKQDPMFSQAAGIKGNSNHNQQGHSPSHISMSVDSILSSSSQRHWTSTTATGSFSSQMNSHNHNNSQQTPPPPFSPPTLSPHFSHQSSLPSAFNFERTSQAQQQIMSPGLSPLSPSAFLKQPLRRRGEMDQHPSKDNDPFLTAVDRETVIFGSFNQGTDNTLSDLRLR